MESSRVSLPRTPSLPAAMFLAANRNTSSPQLKLLDNTSRSLETAAANLSSAKQGESPGEGVRMAVQRIAFAFYSYTSGSVWIASGCTWKNFYFQARITRINGRVAKNYQRKMKRKTNERSIFSPDLDVSNFHSSHVAKVNPESNFVESDIVSRWSGAKVQQSRRRTRDRTMSDERNVPGNENPF